MKGSDKKLRYTYKEWEVFRFLQSVVVFAAWVMGLTGRPAKRSRAEGPCSFSQWTVRNNCQVPR